MLCTKVASAVEGLRNIPWLSSPALASLVIQGSVNHTFLSRLIGQHTSYGPFMLPGHTVKKKHNPIK